MFLRTVEVIDRAGGLSAGLEAELGRGFECQYPHGTGIARISRYSAMSLAAFACAGPATIWSGPVHTGTGRYCAVKPGILADISIRSQLGFNEDHVLTRLCWWLVINDLAHVIPEGWQ
jgi:hypothetical protein